MDTEPIPSEKTDTIDKTSLSYIDIALKQASKNGKKDLENNLKKMRELIKSFPGQSMVRTNDLGEFIDISQDLILHMRNPHLFKYPGKTLWGGTSSILYDTSQTGSDALPILSMKHGVLLVDPSVTIDKDRKIRVKLFNYDMPTALSKTESIPLKGIEIETTPYRVEPAPDRTYKLLYSHVNPNSGINQLDFVRMSLDPEQTY